MLYYFKNGGEFMIGAMAITLLAAFLWGITNHIDKFLLNKVDESGSSIKTLLVFSTLVAGIVLTPIWLIISKFLISISLISLISILLSSLVCVLGIYFYFKALENNDASIVVVMFQMIPVFSYIMAAILFKELLTPTQIIGSIIVILAAIIISFDFEEKTNKNKFKALLLMTLSSLCYSTYYILFDIAIRKSSYNACAFWYQIGLLIIGIILICIKSYRTTFFKAIKNNGKRYFSLNITNEVINLIACLLVNFANLSIPIALANISCGFQTMSVFILGVIGAKFLPKYFTENLTKKAMLQKVGCIALSIIGLIIIFL